MGSFKDASSNSLARLRSGSSISLYGRKRNTEPRVTFAEICAEARRERNAMLSRVLACVGALVVLAYISFGIMGAQGQYYLGSQSYAFYSPIDVSRALYFHAYNALAEMTHWYDSLSQQWLTDNVSGYWAVPHRASVVGITLVCAILLSVSGMLYQAAFCNPIAGPSILGVSSGTGLGIMVLVLVYGAAAPTMLMQRYLLCYGLGALVLVFVILAGRRLSKKSHSLNTLSLLLIGSIVSQLLGFVISYFTLFVMDESTYAIYFQVSEMLVVDTSEFSWICLGIAALISFIPIFILRFRMNALSFNEDEMRPLGINAARMRIIALVCGAIMILAAQIHTGMVGLISLVVPFMARRWFGTEFSHQLVGSICVGTLLLLLCRDIADLIPFVGDGISVGSMVGIVALPLFLVVVARSRRCA